MADLTAEDWKRIWIFFPYMAERTLAAIQKGQKFVHYSSGDSAMKMIQTSEVWMRKTSAMNDPSEGHYGLELLSNAYHSDDGSRLKRLLDEIIPEGRDQFEKRFDAWQNDFRHNTFITSFTEQLDGDEQQNGRLSMWRGYSGLSPVAIVVNGDPFLRPSDALNAYTSPVGYFDELLFRKHFCRLVAGMEENRDFLVSQGESVLWSLFAAFRYAAICTKHPGHREDHEWRVVHTPSLEPSSKLIKATQVIRGRPQVIYKIPLQDIPEEGLYGIEIPALLSHLIIGPGPNQWDTREAFIALLEEKGVEDAPSKVLVSTLPLREPV